MELKFYNQSGTKILFENMDIDTTGPEFDGSSLLRIVQNNNGQEVKFYDNNKFNGEVHNNNKYVFAIDNNNIAKTDAVTGINKDMDTNGALVNGFSMIPDYGNI